MVKKNKKNLINGSLDEVQSRYGYGRNLNTNENALNIVNKNGIKKANIDNNKLSNGGVITINNSSYLEQ